MAARVRRNERYITQRVQVLNSIEILGLKYYTHNGFGDLVLSCLGTCVVYYMTPKPLRIDIFEFFERGPMTSIVGSWVVRNMNFI